MIRFGKICVSVGGAAAVMALLVVSAPKTAHAVVAALVQVANTRSSPVPTQDVDISGRHPFQATCSEANVFTQEMQCNPLPAVPANSEFVIQNVSMSALSDPAYAPKSAQLTNLTAGGEVAPVPFVVFAQGVVASYAQYFTVAQPVTLYEDSNAANPYYCAMDSGTTTYFVVTKYTCTVTGYLVSLP